MLDNGIPLNETALAYSRAEVRQVLSTEGEEYATIFSLGILGAREQANLAAARESLDSELSSLLELPSISAAGVTGSPFTREATLIATTRALTISLPVAAVACFLLLALWMRSAAYAFVTTLPVGLVVSWLYAFMYLTGYSLNFVTATIAAVSIGVGIDYSIHMTQRFRQEMPLHPDAVSALRAAAGGTGAALAGSAASSVVGFAVLGLAPMPLFSTYGIISAVMVLMAVLAALLVLPAMLLVVERVRRNRAVAF
jgi:predicted RND superfamily exporter protein